MSLISANEAQSVKDIEYLDQLMDMKITSGSFLELNLGQSPMSMTIISQEDIKISGARNLSELLEIYVPGFQYMFNKWNGTQWGMRGVANDRNTKIIFLIDGHKMNTQARDGFQGETVLGLMGDIKRVEVLRGPAGLVYGSGAIAGIVNVITDKKDVDGKYLKTAFGTMGSQEIEAAVHVSPSEGQLINFSGGFRRAEGLGIHQSRIYGYGSWPFPGAGDVKSGVPSDGNYGSTDGNWRCSGTWVINNFDLYFRATHQKESAGGWFIQDPWPEILGTPDLTSRPSSVDGTNITGDDPFWSGTESWRTNRFQFISDNVMISGCYSHPVGLNELRVNTDYILNTTRTCLEIRPGYETDLAVKGADYYDGTFGERRLTGNAIFNLNSVPRLQMASGIEYRFDQIGKDIDGKNSYTAQAVRPVVANVNYHTLTLFAEGFYEIHPKLDFHMGGRLDFHSRALMANPKIALIYKPDEKHSIKIIGQSSSNNGSADNYEYNRFHFREDGSFSEIPRFSNEQAVPGRSTYLIQPAPPLDSLHSLQPEKVYSIELAYTGIINDQLTLTPSAAFGNVKNLFGWTQTLFRVVNAGSYRYFNLDLDANYKRKWLSIGMNHTFQRPIATDVKRELHNYKIYTLPQTGPYYDSIIKDGTTYYIPIPADSMSDFGVNLVQDGVTADGQHFLNLNTNLTKMYLTVNPFNWVSLHINAQLFWGLRGRESLYAMDTGYNYWNISDGPGKSGWTNYLKKSVSKKVNMGICFNLPQKIDVSLYVYDLFGIDHPYESKTRYLTINTIRWQQMYSKDQKDLYSTDQRTFEIRVSKSF